MRVRFICKTGTPLVNDMLRAYGKECGMKLQSCEKCWDDDFPYLLIRDSDYGADKIIMTQTTGRLPEDSGKGVSIDEFMVAIKKYSVPSLKLVGHDVSFTKENVKVGCTTIPNDQVDNFIKAYNKFHDKC